MYMSSSAECPPAHQAVPACPVWQEAHAAARGPQDDGGRPDPETGVPGGAAAAPGAGRETAPPTQPDPHPAAAQTARGGASTGN